MYESKVQTGLWDSVIREPLDYASCCPDAEQVPLRFRALRAALMHESKISSHLEHHDDRIKARMIAVYVCTVSLRSMQFYILNDPIAI